MLHKINKLNVFNISIISALWLSIQTVHDKYNQSFGGEREVVMEKWGFQNESNKSKNKQKKIKIKCHFGGIFKTPGLSPQTKFLIYTTSSKLSKKSPCYKRTKKKKRKIKHSLQQPGGERN